jgi:integrase
MPIFPVTGRFFGKSFGNQHKEMDMRKVLDVQTVKNLTKPGRYTDALVRGLHIWVKAGSGKYWIFRYTFERKQRDLALGAFPNLSIAKARLQAQEARDKLDAGIDPAHERKRLQTVVIEPQTPVITFEPYAMAYVQKMRPQWSNAKHAEQWTSTLRMYAFPALGAMPISEIVTSDILSVLQPIWNNKTETASRLRSRIELILAAATTEGIRQGQNPAIWRGHLETVLPSPKRIKRVEHHTALPYQALPALMAKLRKIDAIGAMALEFLILNASRTGEVTGALRAEVSGDIWTIPGSRMKARREHRVPLGDRSLELIDAARSQDPDSAYLFSRARKPLSNMTMAETLRRLGHDVTVHGFRSTFRDWVSEETEHSPEVAEMALAHTIGNKVEAAYRRKDLLPKRRTLMGDWEAFCKGAEYSNVVDLKAA